MATFDDILWINNLYTSTLFEFSTECASSVFAAPFIDRGFNHWTVKFQSCCTRMNLAVIWDAHHPFHFIFLFQHLILFCSIFSLESVRPLRRGSGWAVILVSNRSYSLRKSHGSGTCRCSVVRPSKARVILHSVCWLYAVIKTIEKMIKPWWWSLLA